MFVGLNMSHFGSKSMSHLYLPTGYPKRLDAFVIATNKYIFTAACILWDTINVKIFALKNYIFNATTI